MPSAPTSGTTVSSQAPRANEGTSETRGTTRGVELVFAPYLKLNARATVGPWTMVPASALGEVCCGPTRGIAERLAWAYNGSEQRRGAFAFKTRSKLGRPVRRAHIAALHRALTLAVL